METEVAEAVLCWYWDLILEESLLTFLAIGARLIFLIYFEGVCLEPRLCSQRVRPYIQNPMLAGLGKENKAFSLRELSDRYQYSWQHGCETIGPALPDWLVWSQHHLWLGVHLFCITAPPLDLQLAVEGQLSKNDTEFEDTSWKNTLLMQLRFP